MSNQDDKVFSSYLVSYDTDGTIAALYRLQRSATTIASTAYLQPGRWVEKGSLLWSVFHNLHEEGLEWISDEEAARIAAPYGVIIPVHSGDSTLDSDIEDT